MSCQAASVQAAVTPHSTTPPPSQSPPTAHTSHILHPHPPTPPSLPAHASPSALAHSTCPSRQHTVALCNCTPSSSSSSSSGVQLHCSHTSRTHTQLQPPSVIQHPPPLGFLSIRHSLPSSHALPSHVRVPSTHPAVSHLVLGLLVRARLHQRLRHCNMATLSSQVQRCEPVLPSHITASVRQPCTSTPSPPSI